MRSLALLFVMGCGGAGSDEGPPPDATVPIGGTPPPSTVPDPPTSPPTGSTTTPVVAVSCADTANELRFVCTVEVDPPQPVTLSFARVDGLSPARVSQSSSSAGSHEIPLYFMAPEKDYTVTAWATAAPAEVASVVVTTGIAPSLVASGLTMTGTSTMGLIGTHLPCEDDAVAVVYDTATGDLVWYQLLIGDGTFGSLDMVQFTEDFTVLGESEGDVIEVDLTGADVLRLPNLDAAFGVTANGLFGDFHHDIMKRNGIYYVFYQEEYSAGFNPDVLDTVILFDGTGTELARWYPIDHLALPPDWGGDFLHTNTIFVEPNGDMLLSWLTQNTVARIAGDWTSPDFGTPLWILDGTNDGELGNTISTDWSQVGSPRSFEEQHSLVVRPDGRLQLLDNLNGRGLVISLDEATSTATVDGEFATREASCGPQGTSRSTLGGNPVVGCTGEYVREYDLASGEMIWEAEVQCPGGGRNPGSSRWYPLDGW